jgi:hypothetical protein
VALIFLKAIKPGHSLTRKHRELAKKEKEGLKVLKNDKP